MLVSDGNELCDTLIYNMVQLDFQIHLTYLHGTLVYLKKKSWNFHVQNPQNKTVLSPVRLVSVLSWNISKKAPCPYYH